MIEVVTNPDASDETKRIAERCREVFKEMEDIMTQPSEWKWQAWIGGECPSCGDDAEVFTDTGRDNFAGDGDAARCVACGHPGSVSINVSLDCLDGDGVGSINWHDDPDYDCCDWCRAHKPTTPAPKQKETGNGE